jgi:probable blue pigment (indigoidine) exporter
MEVGLSHASPTFFAATRMYTGAAVLLPLTVVWYEDWFPKTRGDLIGIVVAGLFVTGGSNGLLFYGQQFTTSSAAAVLFAMNPVLATAFAWFLIPSERLHPLELAGVVLGLAGVVIISNPDPARLLAPETMGNWIVLGGAALLGLGSVLSRRTPNRIPIIPLLGWGLLLAAVALHAASLLLGEPTPSSGSAVLLLAILYLGVPSTAGAFIAYYRLLSLAGAVKTTLVSYAVPVFAAVIGWAVIGETIAPRTLAGFLVIAVGFALTEHRRLRVALRDAVVRPDRSDQ